MINQENISKAFFTAKECLAAMMAQGFGTERDLFVLSNMISQEFGLSQDHAIMVMEKAFEML